MKKVSLFLATTFVVALPILGFADAGQMDEERKAYVDRIIAPYERIYQILESESRNSQSSLSDFKNCKLFADVVVDQISKMNGNSGYVANTFMESKGGQEIVTRQVLLMGANNDLLMKYSTVCRK